MSVLETDLVDYIYLDEDERTPVLVVSDPLSWRPPEDERHLDMLRDKLNAQIAFVETGQIKGVWPDYSGGLVRVEVIARCPLTDMAGQFYHKAREVMTGANMDLRFQLLDA
ncbi:MAG: hypothetical protein KGL69_06510 [Alphaproteobacteria bacterium]|nr:hypothetical protein [Alphaproteobacteria bacterium]